MNIYTNFINHKNSLLMIVDIQKVLFDLCIDNKGVKKKIEALIDMAEIMKIPAIFTEHNAKKLGGFLPDLLERASGKAMNKMEFSCFENSMISAAVKQTGKNTIILAGIESHVCIFQSGAQALQQGYQIHVVADAVSARAQSNLMVGLNRLEHAGAVVSSTEMLIFELLKKAGTDDFRKAFPIIKQL